MNSYIRFSILFTVSMGGLGRDERAYINFGRAKFFTTVILPISVSFLCCHCFKHFSKSTILGSKFAWNI